MDMHSHDTLDADLFVALEGGYGSTWTKKAYRLNADSSHERSTATI